MAAYFLDTSALVKRYHPEAGTPIVDQLFFDGGADIIISRLVLVEIVSAFALKVRTGQRVGDTVRRAIIGQRVTNRVRAMVVGSGTVAQRAVGIDHDRAMHRAGGRNGKTLAAFTLLDRGLRHVAITFEVSPQSKHAGDVRAALRFRQALGYWRRDQPDKALELFQHAVREIELLCEEFPWIADYWNSSQWFYREAVSQMRNANRADDALATVRRYRDWLQKMALQVPQEPGPLEKLRQSQTELIALLREAGLVHEARELAESIE